MELSKPEDMEIVESEGNEAVGSFDAETVTMFGEEMDAIEAIELVGKAVDEPEAFGIASESQFWDLRDRLDELEAENERLRKKCDDLEQSIHTIVNIMDEGDSISQFQLNQDPSEFTG